MFADECGDPLNAIGAVRHVGARVVRAAGIADPAPRLHDARDAWAVAMLRAGVAPAALAKLGGWSDGGIRRYGRHALPESWPAPVGRSASGATRDARRDEAGG